jgi:3-phytase
LFAALALLPIAFPLLAPGTSVSPVGRASSTVETQTVPAAGDAAGDVAIWIHPTDASLSTIIGTNKEGGIAVYDFSGRQIQYVPVAGPNSVDLRYDFPLGSDRVSLVAASRKDGSLGVYAVDPKTRSLVDVATRPIRPTIKSYGLCLYQSPATDNYYAFVTDKAGAMEQWELVDDGKGRVEAVRVRGLEIGRQSEGCVADDVHGALYVAEEDVGIWRYGAEPWDGATRRRVDGTGTGGHLTADVEGLAIYHAANGTGYLIASSQGADSFVVYERGDANRYLATFQIVEGDRIDSVSGTDGIDVVNVPLGSRFPEGVFVAHDDANPGGNQNFKLVSWGRIARAVTPKLHVDTSWDPRQAARARRANRPPAVRAGRNLRTALGQPPSVEGRVSDDGLPDPPHALATGWSQVRGPGRATFSTPTAASTRVSLPLPGLYALRLTADDGDLLQIDDVIVEAAGANQPAPRLAQAAYGANHGHGSAAADARLSDHGFSEDDEITQMVAFRFTGLGIPRNAKILSARLEFGSDEVESWARALTIRAHATDDPPALAGATRDGSLWPLTVAGVDWFLPGPNAASAGAPLRTPDLAPVIQEIVCRRGWRPGNAMVVVVTGTGRRPGESSEAGRKEEPVLHLDYRRRPG